MGAPLIIAGALAAAGAGASIVGASKADRDRRRTQAAINRENDRYSGQRIDQAGNLAKALYAASAQSNAAQQNYLNARLGAARHQAGVTQQDMLAQMMRNSVAQAQGQQVQTPQGGMAGEAAAAGYNQGHLDIANQAALLAAQQQGYQGFEQQSRGNLSAVLNPLSQQMAYGQQNYAVLGAEGDLQHQDTLNRLGVPQAGGNAQAWMLGGQLLGAGASLAASFGNKTPAESPLTPPVTPG